MRLATPEAVLSILGIQQGTGVLATAGVALDATFHAVESFLDTELQQQSRIDYFDITQYDRIDPALRLSCSFVSKDETVAVYVTADGLPLNATSGTALASSDFDVDYTIGTVKLLGSFYVGRKTIAVHYTSGFEIDFKNPLMLTGVPDALVRGHASMAAAYMQLNPANVSKEKAKALGALSVYGLEMSARQSMVGLVRPRGTVTWHSHSEVVE